MMHMRIMTLKSIKFGLLGLLLPLFSLAQPGTGGTIAEGIVAVVGENIILKSEIEGNFQAMKRQMEQQGLTITRCQVVEDQLMEKLLLHHAKVDSVEVDESEVQQNIERRIQMLVSQIGSVEALEEYYGKSIPEIKAEMAPLMRNQLTAQRMQFTITQDVEVTPTEVQEFFQSIPTDSLPLINTEVELAQIVVYPAIDEAAEQAAIDELNDIKERIEGGRSFSTMAILYSDDPGSKRAGGLYEGIRRGQFVKEFEAVAFNLQPGEISEPFRTVYGYHIVLLEEKRGEELDLRHILIKPEINQANLDEVRSVLDSVKVAIASGAITFEEAVEQFSEDEGTVYNNGLLMNPQTGDTKFDVSNLDQEMFYAIQGLNEGQISEPAFYRDQEQREAFRLIRVIRKTEPHRANMRDDYGRLRSIALQDKQSRTMREWVEEKIEQTYIRINNNYYDCDFQQNWDNNSSVSSSR